MQEKIQIFLVVNLALILRWCVTYHPYSGEGKPPMYGDYEAQRHWQEITVNLPVNEWYRNTTRNDLQYWGLDYPPLTAYHSFIVGKIAQKIDEEFVALDKSRGFESNSHKYFMRLTVLIADLLSFIPASIILVLSSVKESKDSNGNFLQLSKKSLILSVILLYPGLIIIDYGHFQYNCVSLGAFVAATAAISSNYLNLGAFLFVLALNYKQMELYHALPFFFYILGLNKKFKLKNFCKLFIVSCTVIGSFTLIWLPFISDRKTFFSVIIRLFPLARGVFEDKVANFWCTINVIYKLRKTFDNIQLAQICLVSTTLALLPCCLDLFFKPSREKLLLSLINSSLAFFLFSYQVHEKSILLAAIPVSLHFHNDPFVCFWFLLISTFSMLPLIIKDQLFLALIALTIFFFVLISWIWFTDSYFSQSSDSNSYKKHTKHFLNDDNRNKSRDKSRTESKYVRVDKLIFDIECYLGVNIRKNYLLSILFHSSIGISIILTLCSKFLKAPQMYPDLFSLLVSVYSCIHFIIFFIYFQYKQLTMKIDKNHVKFTKGIYETKMRSNVKLKKS